MNLKNAVVLFTLISLFQVGCTSSSPKKEKFDPLNQKLDLGPPAKVVNTYKGPVGMQKDGSYINSFGSKWTAQEVRTCQSSGETACRGNSRCSYNFSTKRCSPDGTW